MPENIYNAFAIKNIISRAKILAPPNIKMVGASYN